MKKITVIHAAFEETPVTVAEVNVPVETSAFGTTNQCLEYAYRWTNNIQGSWSRDKILTDDKGETYHNNGDYNLNVKVLTPLHVSKNTGQEMGLRSTSMGDIMEFDGKKYKVDIVGFKEIV